MKNSTYVSLSFLKIFKKRGNEQSQFFENSFFKFHFTAVFTRKFWSKNFLLDWSLNSIEQYYKKYLQEM